MKPKKKINAVPKEIIKEKPKTNNILTSYDNFSLKLHLFFNKHSYILYIVAFLFTALGMLVLRKFNANDDIAIIEDIKGGFPVNFMTYSLGKFLSFFYSNISQSITWYGWFMYFLTAVCIGFVLYALNKIENLRKLFIPLALTYLLFAFYFIFETGYNYVSMLSGGTALFAFIVYVFHNHTIKVLPTLLFGFFFSFSYLVREQGIMGVVAVTFPVVGIIFLGKFKKFWKPTIFFFLPIVCFFIFNTIYQKTTLPEAEKQFREFNAVRGNFHGFTVAQLNMENTKIQEVNNWTDGDYKMLILWLFVDENKFNTQTIQNIFDNSYELPQDSEILKLVNYDAALKYYTDIYGKFFMFFIIIFLLVFYQFKPQKFIFSTLYFGFLIALVFYMIVFLRFPERVGNPLLYVSSLFLLLLASTTPFPAKEAKSEKLLTNFIISLFFVLLSIFIFKQTNALQKYVTENKALQTSFTNALENFQNKYEDKILLLQPAIGLKQENQDPLLNYDNKFTTFSLGWGTFSPRFYNDLNKVGLEKGSELFPYLIESEDAYLLLQDDILHIVLKFIRDTYHIHCKIIKVETFEEGVSIYQLKKEHLTPPTPEHFRSLSLEDYQSEKAYLDSLNTIQTPQ